MAFNNSYPNKNKLVSILLGLGLCQLFNMFRVGGLEAQEDGVVPVWSWSLNLIKAELIDENYCIVQVR